MFASSTLASTNNVLTFSSTFIEYQKSTTEPNSDQSLPHGKEFPKEFPQENQFLNIDIEENVEPCEVNYFVSLINFVRYSKKVTFRYKAQENLRFHPDIIPPPPKL